MSRKSLKINEYVVYHDYKFGSPELISIDVEYVRFLPAPTRMVGDAIFSAKYLPGKSRPTFYVFGQDLKEFYRKIMSSKLAKLYLLNSVK